jgi:Fe(3+) dicitrate transport protein
MKKVFFTLLYFILFFSQSFSQNSQIEGHIKLNDSTSVLSGVSLYLEGTNFGSSTNGSGHYIIENIPEGDYTLVVSAIGYFTQKKDVSIKFNEELTANFTLVESISSLSEVMIISGGNTRLKDIPGSVHYISPSDIEKFSYTDINRTLRTVPGVNIQEEDGFGLFPNIGLRGTGVERSSKITLMEDGVLIAPAPYAAPAAYYFPTIGRMQAIEVLMGSSQIKYGPYTTGGAINLISTQIPNEFAGKINLMGGSFANRNLYASVGDTQKRFGYLVETLQHASKGFKEIDLPENRGFDRNSGFAKQDYLAKFRVNTSDSTKVYQDLTFKVGFALADINETYLGLTQKDFNANPIRRYAGSQVDNITTKQSQFSLTHTAKFSESFSINTVAYRTNFDRNWYKLDKVKDATGNKTKIAEILDNPSEYNEAYNIITGTSSINEDALFVKANNRSYYAQGVQTTLGYNFETNKIKHDVDIGFRMHQDQIDRFQWYDEFAMDNGVMELTKAGIHGTESNRIETATAFATYLQYKLTIGKLTATPGFRFENINQKRKDYGNNDPNRTGINLTERSNTVSIFIPGIGLDYKFNKHISTFFGVHKGFAPPGSKEEVAPEESINYELGVRYAKKALSGQVVLFVNDYSNLLGTDLEGAGGGGTNELFNGGDVLTKGLEFLATYDLLYFNKHSNFSLPLSITYTYTDAKFLNDFDSDFGGWGEVSEGDQIPYLAKNQFTFIMGLEHYKFSVNISGKYMDEMRTEPGQGPIPYNEKTDSYFIIDASANYSIHKNIDLFANASNLFNQIYIVARRPAGLRPGMPRAFNIGIKAHF